MRRSLLGLLIVILAACQPAATPTATPIITPTVPTPRLIHHPRPDFPPLDLASFEEVSVFKDQADVFYTNGSTDPSPLARFECREIARPGAALGALTPGYPLATCLTQERGLYSSGCMMPLYTRYVTYRGNQFELLASLDDFKALFAPIDSAPEALSYALAATGLDAVYDIRVPPGHRALVETLEDTHVVEVKDGYQINLYESGHCGCGPNALRVTNVLVTTAGDVTTLNETRVTEDASGNVVCVD
jgi:hypothetical protein